MSLATTVVSFGEWLPDLADVGSPGLLEANNVLPDVDGYIPWTPYTPYAGGGHGAGPFTLNGVSRGLISVDDPILGYKRFYSACNDGVVYMTGATFSFAARSATIVGSSDCQFAQYKNLVFVATGFNTAYHTIGAATNFATMAPIAGVAAVVGQFLVLGNLTDTGSTARPYTVRWSGVDQPTNFQPPNSATAIAIQSGEQDMKAEFGAVQAIVGGDQFALIFQQRAITRMTYVGPPVVFQFDEIQRGRGAAYRHGAVKAAGITYYVADDGFFATDGVTSKPIGLGKIDNTAMIPSPGVFHGAYDQSKKCVYWAASANGFGLPTTKIYAHHVDTGKWSSADATLSAMDQSQMGAFFGPFGIDGNNLLATPQAATAGSSVTARFTTFDSELNPAGRAFVGGVKPNIEYSGTTPAVTVRVGGRNDMGSSPAFTATTTPTTRTGIADVRVDAKYHRAEVQIVGQFTKATGLEFKATPSGEA